MKNPIYPCLWFDGLAKEAADYYCSIFKHSNILEESPVVVSFEINGNKFMALNGGNTDNFNQSISFVVECESQDEIDYYWSKLSEGGEESYCGWLKDRFGISWQIIPAILSDLMKDSEKADKIFKSMSHIRKFNIGDLLKV
ncbi:MAG TPA: VOC family protein [Candidatus Kapabacteria bacterium]|nr:VOC family protein [Candidatus Kapabacteria bacterium]HPO62546.1 VOC family protein [Candidatus Kapabacteria bacterium]